MFDYFLTEKQKQLKQEARKFVTKSCQKAVHNAMQVMDGIGYTNIYPVERIFRDLRLAADEKIFE